MDTRIQAMFELAIARAIVRAVAESAPQTIDSLCEDAQEAGIASDRCRTIIGKLLKIGALSDNGSITIDHIVAQQMGLL